MINKAYIESESGQVARVSFELPNVIWADVITLVGDFNGWDQASHPCQQERDGEWTITVELEVGHAYQFRYLCDGEEWMNDPDADAYVVNPYGGDNFVVVTDPTFKKYNDSL